MKVIKYETNLSTFKFLKQTENISFNTNLNDLESNLIVIYPEITYQEIKGFGGAFTEAVGYCFAKLPEAVKNQFIKDYFSEEGINYSLCRLHIGSSDFCLEPYSYSYKDTLEDFTIDRDKKYIIPLIKMALKENKNISLVSSPWSPPAFMKDNNRLKRGGKLQDKYKNLWAQYLVKYVQAYKKEGIDINYMTIQNEPNASQLWESCQYTAKEEQELIKNHIVPVFKANNITVNLLIWDHNKERLVYRATDIFDDSSVKNMVAGIGYHYYSGDHFENIRIFKELYPDKLVIHTEGCTGYEKKWYKKRKRRIPNAEIYAHDIIGDLNAGANGYIDWNMMLDYTGGPTHINNKCNSPVMLNKKGDNYTKNLSYYYIGHFSKFIKTGAKRIAFSKYTDKLEVTAFKNLDNSIVVVVLNRSKNSKHINLCLDKKFFSDLISGHSIVTFCIK